MRKIPTLFRRDPDQPALITRELHPDCAWVLEGLGQATRKFDGTCVMWDGTEWRARREVKPGKNPPSRYRAEQTDAATGKTVGWEPIDQSSFAKLHAEAIDTCILDKHPHRDPVPGGTYELVGPKVNGNPEKLNEHILVRHGYIAAVERDVLNAIPRDFDGLIEWLLADCEWEGVVWHGPDEQMAKLKVRDALAYVKANEQAAAS